MRNNKFLDGLSIITSAVYLGPTRIAENRITETRVFVKSTELPKSIIII